MNDDYFRMLRQGTVLKLSALCEYDGYYVIVSQSCDVVQPKRELLQIAPMQSLAEPEIFRGAIKRANPRFPLVTMSSGGLFADLARISSVPKIKLVNAHVSQELSITESYAAREFGLAVGRWFGRFAFPDQVQPWLAPLQRLIRDKYDKPESPLGRVLQDVVEVRVEAESWDLLPVALTLHIITRAGVVPTIPDTASLPDVTRFPRSIQDICPAILREEDPVTRALLWAVLAESLATKCQPRTRDAQDIEVATAVSSVVGELHADDEFPLSKVRRSEQLDVDFLSEPIPF